MSKSLKGPNIRELSVPLGGRQFAGVAKSMDGAMDPKKRLSFGKNAARAASQPGLLLGLPRAQAQGLLRSTGLAIGNPCSRGVHCTVAL